jgi:type IV secretion system protein VirB10
MTDSQYHGGQTSDGKLNPDDPRLSLERSRARQLKKGPIILLVAGVGLLLVATIYMALKPKAMATTDAQQAHIDPDSIKRSMPDALRGAANDYGQLDYPEPPKTDIPVLGKPLPGDAGGLMLQKPVTPAFTPPPAPKQPSPEELERRRREQLAREAHDKAMMASVFFEGSQASGQSAALPASGGAAGNHSLPDTGVVDEQMGTAYTMQRDGASLQQSAFGQDKAYLQGTLQAPRSPYEVKAGTLIPAVLITGINSQLPGMIIAQVSEQVFDTVSGRYLLIPQGTRILGQYENSINYGQERVRVVWNRMIFPDGSSIALEGMPGVDTGGQSGFTDQTDNHWGKLAGGVFLSSLLAGTAQSQYDNGNFEGRFYSNVGSEINRTGQRITRKNLDIQPTLEIRQGYPVNILVHKDMILKPYTQIADPALDAVY